MGSIFASDSAAAPPRCGSSSTGRPRAAISTCRSSYWAMLANSRHSRPRCCAELNQKSSSQPTCSPALKDTASVSGAPLLCARDPEQLAGGLLDLAGRACCRRFRSWARASMMRIPAVRTLGFTRCASADQALEHGIIEGAPPLLHLPTGWTSPLSRQRLEGAARPVGQPGRHLRSLEIRPDRRAGAEQHGPRQRHRPHAQSIRGHAAHRLSPQPAVHARSMRYPDG